MNMPEWLQNNEEALEVIIRLDRMIEKARAKGKIRKEDALMKIKAGYLYYARLSQYGDCNTCAKRVDCKLAPQWGDAIRVNCYYYQGPEKIALSRWQQ